MLAATAPSKDCLHHGVAVRFVNNVYYLCKPQQSFGMEKQFDQMIRRQSLEEMGKGTSIRSANKLCHAQLLYN